MKKFVFTYKQTLHACYLGGITQAIIVNLAPLLFVTFHDTFGISLDKIGMLIALNFGVQMLTDLAAIKTIDKIGYRIGTVAAHTMAAMGLILMGILPYLLPDPYTGLVIATVCFAIGGGLIEVLTSPIVEALPGDQKASAMILLHSFYCWGHVGVVLLSTLYFALFGVGVWRFLPILWALIPLVNIFMFSRVPLKVLVEDGKQLPVRKLFSVKIFWLLLLLMVSSGAAETAIAQWSSLFAEVGLGVDKTVGDLLGPCAFAVFMGLARLLYGTRGEKLNLKNGLIFSSALCITGYLITIFSPYPLISLVGCSVCGFAVGIMWPGVLSLSGQLYPRGGTAMFAILALGGDIGCSAGPALVGFISGSVERGNGSFLSRILPAMGSSGDTGIGLKAGLLAAIIFPLIMLLGVMFLRRARTGESDS